MKAGLPSLRGEHELAIFRDLVPEVRERGVRLVCWVLVGNHIHAVVRAESKEAMRDAMRYLFGQLARRLITLWGRKGKVFRDRYHLVIGKAARHAWNMLEYVLANPLEAGFSEARRGIDPYLDVDLDTLTTDRFLASIFGEPLDALRVLLKRMTRGMLPFVPLRDRLQPALPGL